MRRVQAQVSTLLSTSSSDFEINFSSSSFGSLLTPGTSILLFQAVQQKNHRWREGKVFRVAVAGEIFFFE